MRMFLRSVTVCIMLVLAAGWCRAQDITIRAVDGKSGKAIPGEHLLILMFDGASHRESAAHLAQANPTTNTQGVAIVHSSELTKLHLKVLVDFHTQFVVNAADEAFSVAEIRTKGLSAENYCNSRVQLQARPGELIVFARKPTLKERMEW